MGQQQLLLVLLVIIIVGVGTITAIDTMQSARADSNRSSVRQDILMVLNDAQIYYQKPAPMGGGGSSFDGISESHIISINSDNENGSYKINGMGNTVTVVGNGANDEVDLTATATITGHEMEITWSEDE